MLLPKTEITQASKLVDFFCLPIVDELRGDAADERVARVAVGKQGADGEQDLGDGESRTPFILENVEADDSLGVNIAVIDPGPKLHFRWLEGIISGKMNIQEEHASFVHRARGSEDGADPLVQIVAFRARAAVGRRIQ